MSWLNGPGRTSTLRHDLRGRPAADPSEKHMAAITDPAEVGPTPGCRCLPGHTDCAIGPKAVGAGVCPARRELRQAEWAEIDLEKGEWNIPAERMKGWKRKAADYHTAPALPAPQAW